MEVQAQDKEIEIDDLKTRLDVFSINYKSNGDKWKFKNNELKAEIKDLNNKLEIIEKENLKVKTN